MLVFNEGLPRSGKSYDVVKFHVLPALQAGRKVFARLNGFDDPARRALIAAYLSITVERLDELLIHVPSAKVHETFAAIKRDGEWVIPDQLKDCLFVIDEVHDFYVAAGRRPLEPEAEAFFALIGQNGGDGVLMSQYWNRLHSGARCRVERKNVFQKLTAVGLDGRYLCTRYHATSPGRFEKIMSEQLPYDPQIFPLYKGYADGAGNREVYKAGGVTIWRRLRKWAFVIVPVFLLAVVFLWRFLHGDSLPVKHDTHAPVAVGHVAPAVAALPPQLGGGGGSALHGQKPGRDWPAGPSYVWELSSEGRARLAAFATGQDGKTWGVIEWPDDGGKILDRLTLADLRAMGIQVTPARFGVTLQYAGKAIIVTAWPVHSQDAFPGQGQGQVVAASVATSPAPPQAAQSGASDAHASNWPANPMATAYVPPQLLDGPARSDWSPSGR